MGERVCGLCDGHKGRRHVSDVLPWAVDARPRRTDAQPKKRVHLLRPEHRRGDLDQAKQMHNKALEINKRLGRMDGMAINYGNLGLIYSEQRDLIQAEQFVKKSLEINEKLKRLDGLARDYSNLGSFYRQREDIEKAIDCWKKALEIFRNIGMQVEIEKVQGLIDELNDQVRGKK